MQESMKCPVPHGGNSVTATELESPKSGAVTHNSRKVLSNSEWWPDRLELGILHQNTSLADPMAPD